MYESFDVGRAVDATPRSLRVFALALGALSVLGALALILR